MLPLEDLERAAGLLTERLETVPGTLPERKRFALAVHYRQAAEEDVERVETAVDRVRERFPGLRKTGGKKVFELRPDIDWDKGRALRWLLEELGPDGPDILPIYIGDDVTDEAAFRALRDRGLSILVAEQARPSAAHYRLTDTHDVGRLLRHLTDGEARDA